MNFRRAALTFQKTITRVAAITNYAMIALQLKQLLNYSYGLERHILVYHPNWCLLVYSDRMDHDREPPNQKVVLNTLRLVLAGFDLNI